MSSITSRGKQWERRNSLWMLWTFFPFGFFNYISFYYISFRTKQRKWFIAALLYSIPFIFVMAIPSEGAVYDFAVVLMLGAWAVSLFHIFKARPEYLLRLEAKQSPSIKEKELENLRRSISKEYGVSELDAPKRNQEVNVIQQEKREPIKPILQPGTKAVTTLGNNLVDVNKASKAELAAVPGMGAIFAEKVVTTRTQVGQFDSFDNFVEVLAIKPHVAVKLEPHLTFTNEQQEVKNNESNGRIVDF